MTPALKAIEGPVATPENPISAAPYSAPAHNEAINATTLFRIVS